MKALVIACQIIIALGIMNVWLFRFRKPTRWRPGRAANMIEEFQHYGYPAWFMKTIGVAKVTLAFLLIVGIWIPPLATLAASLMAGLMLGAVLTHIKVKDPVMKALPSFTLLVLCIFVAIGSTLTA